MTRIASFAVVFLMLAGLTTQVAGEDKPKDAGKTDLVSIQGTWTLVGMETDGHVLAHGKLDGRSSVYEGDRVALKSKGEVRRRRIVTLDPTGRPRPSTRGISTGRFKMKRCPAFMNWKATPSSCASPVLARSGRPSSPRARAPVSSSSLTSKALNPSSCRVRCEVGIFLPMRLVVDSPPERQD